ncbi:hypothetical protein, partial [Corynebacterium striatum]|uniref:hypothetical protein n=2 Tax=Corynebacterium striatum TaxID=43770 RepID=UPI003AC389B5
VLRQDAILHQANDAVLRILIKFSWHVPDFPIYSNGTKPGTLHIARIQADIARNGHTLNQTPAVQVDQGQSRTVDITAIPDAVFL